MPIEAQVSPLPSELTTPPVTKICLAMRSHNQGYALSRDVPKSIHYNIGVEPQVKARRPSFELWRSGPSGYTSSREFAISFGMIGADAMVRPVLGLETGRCPRSG